MNQLRLTDLNLFSGQRQYENFARFADMLPTVKMGASRSPVPFSVGPSASLPEGYSFHGSPRVTDDFLARTDTAAMLVLKDGKIRHESYRLSGGPGVQWISWSVAKSFVSALVGIAVSEGVIGSVEQPISDYIEVEPGSAYDGVSIRNVLQMSSGARWNEDYNDPTSDVHRLAAAMAGAMSLDSFVATMVPETTPGTLCRYNSGDTQALGALLVRATGSSLAAYMREKLVEPLGFESDSYWLVDSSGMEMAFAGLLCTARDFAKLGELYRTLGRFGDAQIVPEKWVWDSTRVTAAHLQPGRPILADHALALGYGYQWWLLDGARGEYSAIGVYNQLVYVDPSRGVSIVKLSANPEYGTSMAERTNRDIENLEFLRSISAAFD